MAHIAAMLFLIIRGIIGDVFAAQYDKETASPALRARGGGAPELAGASWLTPRDLAWLAGHKVMRHGIVDGHKPFEYIDEDGFYRGLVSDYMGVVGEQLGISFEPVMVRRFRELSRKMQSGVIDIASYLPPVWEHSLEYSDPIIQMPIVMFGRKDAALVAGLEALDKERVVVEKPSRAQEFLARDYPDILPIYVDTPAEGLMAVVNRDADTFIHNIFSVEYYRRKLGLEPLKIISTTPYQFNIKFSVNRELAPLIPMIHKVIAELSAREKKLIFDKWVNVEVERRVEFKEITYWGSFILFLVMSMTGMILYWNIRLKTEVFDRTKDLEESSKKLRSLARHMDKVREEEKATLAREMHDELGHTLAALMMKVRQFGYLIKEGYPKESFAGETKKSKVIHDQLDELEGLVREASNTSRKIMSDLRPSVLEDLGLVAAVDWLVNEFEEHYGIACRIRAPGILPELSDEAAIALFRIVQESLTNVAKHAAAENVEVSIACNDRWVTLQVVDDGTGLDANWAHKKGSYGLQGIRERILVFGGELTLSGRPDNKGVILRVRMRLAVNPDISPDGV